MQNTLLSTIGLAHAIAVLAFACGFGDGDLADVDPAAAPESPTWNGDVQPILEWHCAGCHSADAQTGALEGFSVDSCKDAKRGWGGILTTSIDGSTMPPGGATRLAPWERLVLQRWGMNGGPCE